MPENKNDRDHRNGGTGVSNKTEDELDSRLKNLHGRLGKAEKARQAGELPPEQRATSIGLAFRLATELVAGLVVGGGIGWFLDKWLGTSPILLLVFFMLGAVAGILNVVRTARQLQNVTAADEDHTAGRQDDPNNRIGK